MMKSKNNSVSASTWQRNLYERTSLPDNYTPDDCFLDAIQRNKNVPKYTLMECSSVASRVSLQLSVVALFRVSYVCLAEHWLSSSNLLLVYAVLITYLTAHALLFSNLPRPTRLFFRRVTVFSLFGSGLAPVLYQLTDTISTDSIHSTSTLALLLHLLAHDYSNNRPLHRKRSSDDALSLNAALFSAVCLASRLDSSWDAFILLCIAALAFALFPRIVATASISPSKGPMVASFGICFSSVIASLESVGVAASFVVIQVLVVLLAPYLFVRWQRYKDTIHGPWDEAVPKI